MSDMDQTVDTQQLARDIALLHAFVHGAENAAVSLGGVDTPTLRELVASVQRGTAHLLAQAEAFEARVSRLEALLEGIGIEVADGAQTSTIQVLGGLAK
ncbi:hypothetical protein [uncultured Desulfovibrio sp.]|uniref:hypothetical protein n=1 Tax=uncultured Desulfovibrio sp. TaxID=167968 RepID=UPI00260FE8C6|nr:hypothetical protein [uncultured Desulfovibrio sp.]